MPAPPSIRSLSSPGIPDHAIVAGLAEHLVVAVAAGQHVVARAAEQRSRCRPCRAACRCRPGRTAGPRPSRRSACRCRRRRTGWRCGNAPFVSLSVIDVVAAEAERRDQVGVRDASACRRSPVAPPFTRILPAALRLNSIVLALLLPKVVRTPPRKSAVHRRERQRQLRRHRFGDRRDASERRSGVCEVVQRARLRRDR